MPRIKSINISGLFPFQGYDFKSRIAILQANFNAMSIKTRFLIPALLLLSATAFSQGLKVTALGGYTIQDKVYGYYGDVIIRDGPSFTGILSYQKSNQMAIEFTYHRQETTFTMKDYYSLGASNLSGDYKGSINYYMLGASSSPDFSAKVAPFGGIMLGAVVFTPKDTFESETRFALGGKLGVIVHASDRVGIVIQTQLMVPVQGVGMGVGCGTSGCGGGTYTTSTATQLGFSGGLEIKLND